MSVQPSLTETTISHSSRSAEGTRLHGRRLVLARVVWVAVVGFTLSIFLLSLPAYFAQLQTVCVGVTCVFSYGQLTPGTAQALQNLGLSTGGYAVSILALAIASALVFFGSQPCSSGAGQMMGWPCLSRCSSCSSGST